MPPHAKSTAAIHERPTMLPSDYLSGEYFETLESPDQDSPFKTENFLDLFQQVHTKRSLTIQSYIDVGCGGGGNLVGIRDGLRALGQPLTVVKGYDMSPHVAHMQIDGVELHFADFCEAEDFADLITLFDVIEHVPATVDFVKAVAERSHFIGLHIPLDRSLTTEFLDRFRVRLAYPGHLIYLDAAAALTMLTYAGLIVLDYKYTMGFEAPSGRESTLQRRAYPFRKALARVSPWLLSRTLGGVSLMVLAATPSGQRLLASDTGNR